MSSKPTTPIPLTDCEIVHLRCLLAEEQERFPETAPSFDAMREALADKLASVTLQGAVALSAASKRKPLKIGGR